MLSYKSIVVGAIASLSSYAGASGLTGLQIDISYLRWQGSGVSFFQPCVAGVLVGPGVECSYSDPGNTFTADFTDTQLIIDQYVSSGYQSLPWNFEVSHGPYQDLGFKSMTLVYSDFPAAAPSAGVGGLTYSIRPYDVGNSGSGISVSFGGVQDGGHHFRAVFDMQAGPVPEPASYALTLVGLAAILARRRLARRPR